MRCTWDGVAQSDLKGFSCKSKAAISPGTCYSLDLPPQEVTCYMNLCADASVYPCLQQCKSDDDCPLFISCKTYTIEGTYKAQLCGDDTP